MTRPIINLDEIEFSDWSQGERFEARLGQIAARIGGEQLGYNLTVLPPGKRAFPIHSHRVNEEMFFIIDGEGILRLGEETHSIRPGDVIACPAGGPETAHQIINTSGESDLRFLAVSTTKTPDICDYTDSGKTGIYFRPGDNWEDRLAYFTSGPSTDPAEYWEGEDTSEEQP